MISFTRVVRSAQDVNSRLHQWTPTAVLLGTLRGLSTHGASDMAAGIAYYALFSIFPLTLGIIALLGFFMDAASVERTLISLAQDNLPGAERLVTDNIRGVVRLRGALGAVSVLGLLWSGSAVFGAINRALDKAWEIDTPRAFYKAHVRQIALAVGLGALLVFTIASTTFVLHAERLAATNIPGSSLLKGDFLRATIVIVSTATSLAMLTLLYQFATSDHILWRYLWPGALLAGVLFEIAKDLFVLYLREFVNFQQVYGSVSSVIVLLLWAYVSAYILILGAEFSAAIARRRSPVAVPSPTPEVRPA